MFLIFLCRDKWKFVIVKKNWTVIISALDSDRILKKKWILLLRYLRKLSNNFKQSKPTLWGLTIDCEQIFSQQNLSDFRRPVPFIGDKEVVYPQITTQRDDRFITSITVSERRLNAVQIQQLWQQNLRPWRPAKLTADYRRRRLKFFYKIWIYLHGSDGRRKGNRQPGEVQRCI